MPTFIREARMFSSYLLQRPRLRIDDEASHQDVLRHDRVGFAALLRHECLVESNNWVDHCLFNLVS